MIMYKIVPMVNGQLDVDYRDLLHAIDNEDGTYIVQLQDTATPRQSWRDATEQDWQNALAKVPPPIPPGDLTPEQRYALLDPNRNTLADYQQTKIAVLDDLCNKTILAGFTSSALGAPHQYDFDEEAQRNFAGALALMNADSTITSITWKTVDAGPLPHTRDQFIQLCKDGFAFKESQIQKYWNLKAQVQQASSIDQVNAITW
jgi:hypothetical protein